MKSISWRNIGQHLWYLSWTNSILLMVKMNPRSSVFWRTDAVAVWKLYSVLQQIAWYSTIHQYVQACINSRLPHSRAFISPTRKSRTQLGYYYYITGSEIRMQSHLTTEESRKREKTPIMTRPNFWPWSVESIGSLCNQSGFQRLLGRLPSQKGVMACLTPLHSWIQQHRTFRKVVVIHHTSNVIQLQGGCAKASAQSHLATRFGEKRGYESLKGQRHWFLSFSSTTNTLKCSQC